MNKLKTFVRLDFVTVKPYFTVKNMLLYAAVAVFMSISSQSLTTAIAFGLMYATLNVGYPFSLGEKNNMDALYATLGADRKTVVRGRYIFSLLLNVCGIVFVAAISVAAIAIAGLFGVGGADALLTHSLWGTLGIGAAFLIIQAMQIPVYFKLGYAKAKLFTVLPFFVIFAFSGFIMSAQGRNMPEGINNFIQAVMNNAWAIGAVALAVLVIAAVVSYNLSLVFYRKREF